MPHMQKKRRWTIRHTTRAMFALACLGTAGFLLWMAFGPPPGMPLSKETTGFIGPFSKDGNLDTWAAVRRSKGWPEEKVPHVWHELLDPQSNHPIKYRDPYEVPELRRGDQRGYTRRGRRRTRPFDESDDAEYASLIDENEEWYTEILKREPSIDSPVWSQLEFQSLAEQFCFRAMLAFGRGDHDRGIESLRFMSRIAKKQRRWLVGEGDLLTALEADKECWEAIPQILFELEVPPAELCEFAFEFGEPVPLPEIAARVIDDKERYHTINMLSYMFHHHDRPPAVSLDGIRRNWFLHRVNWRRFAKTYHKFVDGFVDRIKIDDDRQRTPAVAAYRREFLKQFKGQSLSLDSWRDVVVGDATTIAEQEINAKSLWWIAGQIDWDRRKRRQVRLAVYLARYRATHDRFPATLDELGTIIPNEHQSVLLNNLTGKPWFYETRNDGAAFVLRQAAESWVEMQWGEADDSEAVEQADEAN